MGQSVCLFLGYFRLVNQNLGNVAISMFDIVWSGLSSSQVNFNMTFLSQTLTSNTCNLLMFPLTLPSFKPFLPHFTPCNLVHTPPCPLSLSPASSSSIRIWPDRGRSLRWHLWQSLRQGCAMDVSKPYTCAALSSNLDGWCCWGIGGVRW